MTRALQRAEDGQARVIPILLRPCDWQNSPVGKLQILPGVRPVVEWPVRDDAGWACARYLLDTGCPELRLRVRSSRYNSAA